MDQPQLPSSANKLLRPVRRPSAGVQACANYNDLVSIYAMTKGLSTIIYSLFIFRLEAYPLDSGDPRLIASGHSVKYQISQISQISYDRFGDKGQVGL
jgi:hypothetical protein